MSLTPASCFCFVTLVQYIKLWPTSKRWNNRQSKAASYNWASNKYKINGSCII